MSGTHTDDGIKEQSMKEKFDDFNFKPETKRIIDSANKIIREYQMDGYSLTLRQLYYQFVARDIIENSQKSYNRLGDIISNARLNGDLDWAAIEDRTRSLEGNVHWDNPAEIIDYYSRVYKIDTRIDQPNYIEVWVEKEALAGVVERICRKLDINFFACRGYVSQTAMYEASKRFISNENLGKNNIILHLGDHDPSGIDMTRDIRERLNDCFGAYVEVKRIALNMEQIEEFAPPPNPAKLSDSRCDGYMKKFGKMSWELDALDPNTLNELISSQVASYTDFDKKKALELKQQEGRNLLSSCSMSWDEVQKMLTER